MPGFPYIIQPDAMDCGPVCLKMVARYYGRDLRLGRLRKLTYQTREGVSLLSMADAATGCGFRSQGVRLPVSGLEAIPLPAILHWEQNHYVVLYKIRKQRKGTGYRIADPASGLREVTGEELLQAWASTHVGEEPAGIALLLETTPRFFKEEDEPEERRGLRFFGRYLRPYRKLLVQLMTGFLTASLISLLFPFLTQAIVDVGIGTRDASFIVLVLLAQLLLMAGQAALGFIRSWIMLHMSARISISLISDFLIRLMKMPVSFFDTRMTGDLRQRIEDNTRIHAFLTTQLVSISFGVFMLLIYSVVLALYSWKIFLVFLAGSAVYIGWILMFLKKRRELDNRRFEALAANQSNLYQLITGMQEIKLNNCEKRKRWEWERIQVRLFRVSEKALMLHQRQQAGSLFIHQAKNILIIYMAARSVLDGGMTLGMLMAVQFILGQLNVPLQEFMPFAAAAQDARISLDRLGEIHQSEEENELEGPVDVLPEARDLLLERVSFRYEGPRSPKVLDEVTLNIPRNKVTAIVGPSGSGKTTLIKLLLGFYPPVEGEIRVGEVPLGSFNKTFWRSQCGVVMQDGFIFSDTIAGNVAPGEELPDKEALTEALRIAHATPFIEALPLGLQTRVGQEGSGLSQGQKQRLLIARAVYRNPAFLFLDEATNALDATNERTILENLGSFYRTRTVVVVAHRLSTVRKADQIVVLDKGRVTETGTHEELTARRGTYYQLVKNQLELGT